MSGIGAMFDRIAHRYDLLNHLFSLNIDRSWRRTLAKTAETLLTPGSPRSILDCCSGTGDQAVYLAKRFRDATIVGIDIAERMLEIGREKMERKSLAQRVELRAGDAEALEFPDESFDLVTMSFGFRNIIDKRAALGEIERVMRPGAYLLILEFSPEPAPLIRRVFGFYRGVVMPAIGGKLSGSPEAFRYLSSSIEGFLTHDQVEELLGEAGFLEIDHRPLSAGIACLHIARSESERSAGPP